LGRSFEGPSRRPLFRGLSRQVHLEGPRAPRTDPSRRPSCTVGRSLLGAPWAIHLEPLPLPSRSKSNVFQNTAKGGCRLPRVGFQNRRPLAPTTKSPRTKGAPGQRGDVQSVFCKLWTKSDEPPCIAKSTPKSALEEAPSRRRPSARVRPCSNAASRGPTVQHPFGLGSLLKGAEPFAAGFGFAVRVGQGGAPSKGVRVDDARRAWLIGLVRAGLETARLQAPKKDRMPKANHLRTPTRARLRACSLRTFERDVCTGRLHGAFARGV
jgi:hypothetical protein